jgi:hypothetical protein
MQSRLPVTVTVAGPGRRPGPGTQADSESDSVTATVAGVRRHGQAAACTVTGNLNFTGKTEGQSQLTGTELAGPVTWKRRGSGPEPASEPGQTDS